MTVPTSVLQEIKPEFVFTSEESEYLLKVFLDIKVNPYTHRAEFKETVAEIIAENNVPQRFKKFVVDQQKRDHREYPFIFIKNCPIDPDLPMLDFENPVEYKREHKKTFVAEAFLECYGLLMDTPPIGYINVNNGDVFQDIAPKKSLQSTQSQKALERIFFHKDLANHFVRPDFVNILTLRHWHGNKVYTSFTKNKEVYDLLSEDQIETLKKPLFHTPYDDLTVMDGKVKLGEADIHPVISGDLDFRYFENRTVALDPKAKMVLVEFNEILHKCKKRVQLVAGDFIGEHNNYSIHCKEVIEIVDPEKLKERWLMKTVNVYSLAQHESHYLPNRYGIVNG